MALSIRAQALSGLAAFALGAGLGLLYDLLRPARRLGGSGFWDFLFCLLAAAAAFLFAMRSPNGVFGSAELLLTLLGLLLYFELLSPLVLPFIGCCDRKFGVFCINTQKFLKKVSQTAKKLFQKRRK